MSNPDAVFNLLKQMREAKAGQRIVTQGRLNLSIEKPDEGEDTSAPAGDAGDPEASNNVGGESSAKRESRGIR